MEITPYLNFNGQCEEAIGFYQQLLNGRIVGLLRYGDAPACGQIPPEWKGKIMHARLEIDGQTLMAADAPPQHYVPPQGFFVSITVKCPAEAERIFTALSEGGTVRMPVQRTFWSPAFGMAVDRFGTSWAVNTEEAQTEATASAA